jgi:ribosomal protein S18 acetylase RimI-like enzyme
MSIAGEFCIKPLDAARHRRAEFGCESQPLTDYLRKQARQDMAAKTSVCFVLVPVSDPGRIAGYYTLSASSVLLAGLPAELSGRLPKYPNVPATLLGRLARDVEFKGMGIGPLLMRDALERAWMHSTEIGSVAVVTDPKDARATEFYRQFGFRTFEERRMVLPMQGLDRWLKALRGG